MVKELKTEIEHEDIKSKTSPVSLEAILDMHNAPTIVSVHYFKKEFNKDIDDEGLPRYSLGGETKVYQFDYRKKELKRAADYSGNFQEKGYRWDEHFLREYLPGDITETEKVKGISKTMERRTYILVKKIIRQLEEDYHSLKSSKEKKDYKFFIRVLKKVNISPAQKGKQMDLL